jgi:hypothetical protein
MIEPRAMRDKVIASVWQPAISDDVTPECFAGACVVRNACRCAPMAALAKGLAPAKRYRGFSLGIVRDTAIQDVVRSHEHAGMPKGAASPSNDRSDPLPGNGYTTRPEMAMHSSTATTAARTAAISSRAATKLPATMNGRAAACAAERAEMPSEVGKGAQRPTKGNRWWRCRRAGSGEYVHKSEMAAYAATNPETVGAACR